MSENVISEVTAYAVADEIAIVLADVVCTLIERAGPNWEASRSPDGKAACCREACSDQCWRESRLDL